MFATVSVRDWDEACSIGALLPEWGFRGHLSSDWTLESTLARTAKQFGCRKDWLNYREHWMLRQFKRRFSTYLHNLPTPTNNLDWLAVIQHYGGVTRLLDFSSSFYVAAFFAIERANEDAAIWAVNRSLMNKRIAATLGFEEGADIDEANSLNAEHIESSLGLKHPPEASNKLVFPVEPKYLHERLTSQQGFFLCPVDLLSSFQQNLEEMLGLSMGTLNRKEQVAWSELKLKLHTISVLKIIIPHIVQARAALDLQLMNISSSTLFPGLDGYARSMLIHLRVFPEEEVEY
jgi:hypothetical protein